jgi:hypothetical protein
MLAGRAAPVPDLRELVAHPPQRRSSRRTRLAALIELLALQAVLASRARGVAAPPTEPVPTDDSWITADEAARIAGVTRRVVYGWSRCKEWSRFTARPSRKVLRIKRGAFVAWLESTGRGGGRP